LHFFQNGTAPYQSFRGRVVKSKATENNAQQSGRITGEAQMLSFESIPLSDAAEAF